MADQGDPALAVTEDGGSAVTDNRTAITSVSNAATLRSNSQGQAADTSERRKNAPIKWETK